MKFVLLNAIAKYFLIFRFSLLGLKWQVWLNFLKHHYWPTDTGSTWSRKYPLSWLWCMKETLKIVYRGSRRIQATARFIGWRSLALFLLMYLFRSVKISLNSMGTSETYPIKMLLRCWCMIHLMSDCKGATSWIGGPCSASLAGGCGGKMRVIISLKLSVGLATRLPSVEMVSWPSMHSLNWWRWRCGIFVSRLIG